VWPALCILSIMRRLHVITFSGFAAVLLLCVSGCGTLLNLCGYENTGRALRGPYKGQVVVIPQAAVYGGIRQDVAFASASSADWIQILIYLYLFEFAASFSLDTVLLPITIPLNSGSAAPVHPRAPLPDLEPRP